MAVLITRPEPDNAATADALRQRGFDVLSAPLLHFQALPFRLDDSARYAGAIVTSANAIRAIKDHPLRDRLKDAPVYAVGARTAEAARASGFANVLSADGDLTALRKLVVDTAAQGARKTPLFYLAGTDVSGDIAAELAKSKIAVTTLTVYRMTASDQLPDDVTAAFAAHKVEAVLHYSSRSAESFVVATRRAGLEVVGLGVLQLCISDDVARILREAGAMRVVSAEKPQEAAMIDALERTLRSPVKPAQS